MQQACTNRENAAVIFLWAARRCENRVKTGLRSLFCCGLDEVLPMVLQRTQGAPDSKKRYRFTPY